MFLKLQMLRRTLCTRYWTFMTPKFQEAVISAAKNCDRRRIVSSCFSNVVDEILGQVISVQLKLDLSALRQLARLSDVWIWNHWGNTRGSRMYARISPDRSPEDRARRRELVKLLKNRIEEQPKLSSNATTFIEERFAAGSHSLSSKWKTSTTCKFQQLLFWL